MNEEANGRFASVADAFAAAEQALAGDAVDAEDTPVSVEAQPLAEDAVEDIEQPVEAESEQNIPQKLADLLVEEEEQPDTSDSPTISDDTVFVVGDEELTVRELKDRGLRLKDYTQKTQQLADERRELGKASELWDMLKDDPTSTIAQLALEANLIDEAQYEAVTAGRKKSVAKSGLLDQPGVDQSSIEELVAAKVAEVLGQDEAISKVRQRERSAQVFDSLRALEGKYSLNLDDADRAAVLQTAVKMEEPNLEVVLLRMLRQVEEKESARDRVKQASSGKHSTTAVPKEKAPRPKSIRDAWQMAEAAHQ